MTRIKGAYKVYPYTDHEYQEKVSLVFDLNARDLNFIYNTNILGFEQYFVAHKMFRPVKQEGGCGPLLKCNTGTCSSKGCLSLDFSDR